MAKQTKIDTVAELRERIAGSEALLLAEYRGLTVHETSTLRRSLADVASFAVVKNTLMKRAAAEAGVDAEVGELLNGPTAVAFVTGDVVAAAKKVADAMKSFPALVLKGAYLEGRVLREADAKALASLDSREVMLSKIAGMLQSEMSRAASMFQAVQSRFLGLLEAYREKLPAAGTAPAEVAATSAPEAAASEPEAGEEPTAAEPAASEEAPAAEAAATEGEE
ncbi:MAG: 50S ribosomal protein L10 [Actinomycetota bacterium]